MASIKAIDTEVGYDLLHEHFDVMLALLDTPLPRAQVNRMLGCPQALERLQRHGLVRCENDRVHAVAPAFHQLRQENMLTFLEHYVLPTVVANLDNNNADGAPARLETAYLDCPVEEVPALRTQQVLGFFNELSRISDLPASGSRHRLTVLVYGTTRVVRDPLTRTEQALKHLQNAASQRAREDEKDQAILIECVFLADQARHAAAQAALGTFLDRLQPHRVDPHNATLHLSVATHWHQTASPDMPCPADSGWEGKWLC